MVEIKYMSYEYRGEKNELRQQILSNSDGFLDDCVSLREQPADTQRLSGNLNQLKSNSVQYSINAEGGRLVLFSFNARGCRRLNSGYFVVEVNGQTLTPVEGLLGTWDASGVVHPPYNWSTYRFEFVTTGFDTLTIGFVEVPSHADMKISELKEFYIDHFQTVGLARGSHITTSNGDVAVEYLQVGDRILTGDNGFQPVRWIGKRLITYKDAGFKTTFAPIRLGAHSLGTGLPNRDLLISQRHRILIQVDASKRTKGSTSVLASAKFLTELPDVSIDADLEVVEYFYLLFDKHEIIFAEGLALESLYFGKQALRMLSNKQKRQIYKLFPQYSPTLHDNEISLMKPLRLFMNGNSARNQIRKHMRDETPIASVDSLTIAMLMSTAEGVTSI